MRQGILGLSRKHVEKNDRGKDRDVLSLNYKAVVNIFNPSLS